MIAPYPMRKIVTPGRYQLAKWRCYYSSIRFVYHYRSFGTVHERIKAE